MKPWGWIPFEGQIDKTIEQARNKFVNEKLKPIFMDKLGRQWFELTDVPPIPVEFSLGANFEIILSSVETTRETFNGVQYSMAYGILTGRHKWEDSGKAETADHLSNDRLAMKEGSL